MKLAAPLLALTLLATPARARADEVPAQAPAAESHRTVWPWVLMGTGVAFISTALVLEISAVRQDDKRESDEVKLTGLTSKPANDPSKLALQASIDDHAASASHERTAALIVGTVGFLTVAGSVVLWFFEGSSTPSRAPSARLEPTFTPSLGPSYAGANFGASF